MRHDVCMKQRLYDEFLDDLKEECLAMLMQPVVYAGTTTEGQRVAVPIYVAIPQFTITVNVEL